MGEYCSTIVQAMAHMPGWAEKNFQVGKEGRCKLLTGTGLQWLAPLLWHCLPLRKGGVACFCVPAEIKRKAAWLIAQSAVYFLGALVATVLRSKLKASVLCCLGCCSWPSVWCCLGCCSWPKALFSAAQLDPPIIGLPTRKAICIMQSRSLAPCRSWQSSLRSSASWLVACPPSRGGTHTPPLLAW